MYIYEDFTHLFSYKDYLIYVQLWRILILLFTFV